MSSAEIASTMPSEFFLISKLFCSEARIPVTVISVSSSEPAAGASAALLGSDTAVKEIVDAPPQQIALMTRRRSWFDSAIFIVFPIPFDVRFVRVMSGGYGATDWRPSDRIHLGMRVSRTPGDGRQKHHRSHREIRVQGSTFSLPKLHLFLW